VSEEEELKLGGLLPLPRRSAWTMWCFGELSRALIS